MPMYPVTSKENSRRVRAAIRHVFLDLWDPIGVQDSHRAQDEYDSYIGRAFELLMADASDKKLDEYLNEIVEGMGMDSSRRSHEDVIQALREIDLAETPAEQS